MTVKERALLVTKRLDEFYTTELTCYLNHDSAWQLLFATILSAQCTDARVNIVTEKLFKKYRTLEDFSKADIKEACATELLERYNGEVPRDIESLTALSGVGRKTANVIRGNIYHEPSIVVDTHVKRISGRLGLTKEDDPVKIEFDLMKVLPKDHWILYNIQIIRLGRNICFARNPKCEECFLRDLCKAGKGK